MFRLHSHPIELGKGRTEEGGCVPSSDVSYNLRSGFYRKYSFFYLEASTLNLHMQVIAHREIPAGL